jgi:5-epi-alpha-selinene synthase
MNAIAVPEFYCPFESGVNPCLGEIQENSLRWISEIGFAEAHERVYHRSKLESHAALVAHTLPHLPLPDLQLAADAMTWFFIHDDYMDGVFRGSRDALEALHRKLLAACENHASSQPADALSRGLHDICGRIAIRSGADWLHVFVCRVREFVQAVAWEQDLRARGAVPDLATYMLMRPVVGTIYMVFTIVAMLSDIPAEAKFLQHLYIRKLTDLAGLQMTFYNDVWSFSRDLGEGNPCNLVSVLQNEDRIDLQRAVNLAVSLTNKQVVAFLGLKSTLPCLGPQEDPMAQKYIAGLENFMSGHRNWMMRTPRFDIP